MEYDETRLRSTDERLTDYLLGELPEGERAELEAALESDAALRAHLHELSATVGLLRGEAVPAALAAERRDAIRTAAAGAAPAAAPAGKVLRFPWARVAGFTAVAAALLLIVDLAAPEVLGLRASRPSELSAKLSERKPLDGDQDSTGYSGAAKRPGETARGEALGYWNSGDDSARQAPASTPKSGESGALDQLGYGGGADRETPPPAGSERLRGLEDQSQAAPGTVLRLAEESLKADAPEGKVDPLVDSLGLSFATAPSDTGAVRSAELGELRAFTLDNFSVTTPGAGNPPQLDGALWSEGFAGGGGSATTAAPADDATARSRFTGPGDSVPPAVPSAPAPAAAAPAAPGRAGLAAPPAEGRKEELRAGLATTGYTDEAEVDKSGATYQYRGQLEPLERGGAGEQPGFGLYDGYGRCYRGEQVFQYLRPCRDKESPRDMFFRFYGDNPFVNADSDHFSTFAADVDTASYPLVRNYLVNGSIPPKAAIRTEEFVNYFKSELAPPKEGDFAITIEQAPSAFGGDGKGLALLKVGIKAREVAREQRKPVRLTFVIDSSGSMAEGNRLELVQRTLSLLVEQMRDDDQIGIVTFNSDAREVLPPTAGEERWKIRSAIDGLQSGGSTNAEAGLLLGYRMAESQFREGAVNRVILASDGVANTGMTDQDKILEEVKRRSERSMDLTTVGVGMNNHNDVLLEQLADKGNGSCHYVDDDQEARRVFVEGFVGTLQTVARDVKVQVEFNPEVVRSWRQLGYENRAVADQDFRNDAVDAGEIGAGHEVVALYEVEPVAHVWDGPAPRLATVRLRWKPDGAKDFVEMEQTLDEVPAIGRFATHAARFRLSAVAAQYAEVLRRSYWAQGDSYQALVEQSEALARELPGDSAVVELRDMIRKTRTLAEAWPPSDELAQLIEEGRRCRLMEAELVCRDVRTQQVEDLLAQLRRQNDEIERRLADLLAQRR